MTTQEINEGIKLICETSKIIQNCYESKQALVDEINNAKKDDIEKCWQYYKDKSGVVIDVRKELFFLDVLGKESRFASQNKLMKDSVIYSVAVTNDAAA